MKCANGAWFVVLLASGVGLRAQPVAGVTPEPLASDRPGFSDGVNVLPSGTLQLEGGLSLTSSSAGSAVDRTFIGGSPMLRLGIGRGLELRFGGDGFRRDTHRDGGESERAAGVSDYSLGAKFGLVSEKGLRPALTFISMLSLPVGSPLFSSGGVDPTVKLAWSKTLSESTAASGNVVVSSLSDSGGRFTERAVSFQLSRAVWRNWAGFGEAYLVAPVGRGGDNVWTFDGGLSYPIGPNAQFDVSAGQQVAPPARCWFVGAGLVVRHRLWPGGRRKSAL